MRKLLFTILVIIPFIGVGQTETDFINSGLEKSDKNDHYGAIADFTKAIEINSENFLAFNFRGLSKTDIGDYYGSIVDFRNAIKLQPNNPKWTHYFYDNMGVSMMDVGDDKGAIAVFDKSIQLNPDYANAYLNRGTCRSNLGYDGCEDWRLAAYRGSKSAQNKLKNCN